MEYTTALDLIHELIKPSNYLEIGCRQGKSLSLSRCSSIGIDPEFNIKYELKAPTRLFRLTSDEFFSQYSITDFFKNGIELAFIDGMHLVEYALRDFINIEKNATGSTLIVVDDVLPKKMRFTSRIRRSKIWTGDVYQLISILKQYRPDLHIDVFNIDMTGMALIYNLSPSNRILPESYDAILKDIKEGSYRVKKVSELMSQLNPQSSDSLTSSIANVLKLKHAMGI